MLETFYVILPRISSNMFTSGFEILKAILLEQYTMYVDSLVEDLYLTTYITA